MKLDRNGPCWCQSGIKYKKCHLSFDEKLQQLKTQGKRIPTKDMIKNNMQIEGIKKVSKINTGLLDLITKKIKVGMSTEQIDLLAREYTKAHGAICADFQYMGFPKSICTSINDVVCHGIPCEIDILQDGDIINVDATTMLDGYYADASRMFMIGNVSPQARQLVEVTKECLYKGMESIVPYQSCIGDIGEAIETYAKSKGYSVVQEFCGHGVGLAIHEEPYIYHFKPNEATITLVPGMVFTIEPMVNQGSHEVYIDSDDGWTVYTNDGKLTAQWEHTFLVTETGIEILAK